MNYYLLITLLCLSFTQADDKKNELNWTKPILTGHWELHDVEIVDEVPFLNLQAPKPDPMGMIFEDSPWDSYTKYDLVFENDSIYWLHYPIEEALAPAHYLVDTGYIHIAPENTNYNYPVKLINDTLLFYKPLRSEPGYFKETFVRTNFNDSIFNLLKKHRINYPELAGTWVLVREEDYNYGTHYKLNFPHSIPDSIEFNRAQMIAALDGENTYIMSTDGIQRDYSFYYRESRIYLKPGKWYKEGDNPSIYFYKK